MSTSNDADIRGVEMRTSEIEAFLTETGYGTLSVASDDRAYSVPISIGYDGERLFMNLIQFGDSSRKLSFLEDTAEACIVAMDVEDRFDWRSVVVTGRISEVSEDEAEYHEEVLDDNAWFPVIYPPTEPLRGRTRVVLEPTEITGRKGEAHQSE